MDQSPPNLHEARPTIAFRKAGLLNANHISPAQAAALWTIGLLPSEEVGALALSWLEQGVDNGSPEIAAIALNPPTSLSAMGPAFVAGLTEMGVSQPNWDHSVLVTLELCLRAIIAGRVSPKAGMSAINELYSERGNAEIRHPKRAKSDPQSFLGEELGLEFLYTWYRELQDADDGSPLFYYNELPRELQLAKVERELVTEARILHSHLCDIYPDICAAGPS